jgi:uncharacterized membrane protein
MTRQDNKNVAQLSEHRRRKRRRLLDQKRERWFRHNYGMVTSLAILALLVLLTVAGMVAENGHWAVGGIVLVAAIAVAISPHAMAFFLLPARVRLTVLKWGIPILLVAIGLVWLLTQTSHQGHF